VDQRTVLLGINNPLSDDDRSALFPAPVNCTGWRLWQMLRDALPESPPGRADYTRSFDRRNVLHARAWSKKEARAAGAALLPGLEGRRVVVLGVQTLAALGLPRRQWGEWSEQAVTDLVSEADACAEFCLLPHPSGLCREYNDPAVRALAGRVLAEEYARAGT
jgi:hypothetical protein